MREEENMAEQKTAEKLKEAMKTPAFWARIAEAQERIRETTEHLRESSRLPPNWRDMTFTI